MAIQDTPANATTTELDPIHAEWAAANAAYDQATADLQAATDAAHAAQQRKAQARMALPVVERYAPLVGSAVGLIFAGSGSMISVRLIACYAEGCLATLGGKETPNFYPWSAVEDIQPA